MSESPQASSSIDATAVDDGCDSASNASTCSDGDMGGGGTDGIANEKWNIWSREASALSLSAADSKLSLDQKMRVACPELFADVAVDPGQIGQVDKANRDAFHRAQTLRSSVRKVVAGRSMYGSLNSGISVLSLDPAAAARAGDAHPEEADKGVLRVFLRWMSPLIEVARRGQVLAGDLWACPRSADVKRSAKRLERAWTKELNRLPAADNQVR